MSFISTWSFQKNFCEHLGIVNSEPKKDEKQEEKQNDPPGTVVSRIGDKAAKGFGEGFGGNWFTRSAAQIEAARKSGIYNDYSRNWTTSDYVLAPVRGTVEFLNETSAHLLEVGVATPLKTINGLHHGGANAIGQTVAETGLISENQGQRIELNGPRRH